MPAFTYFYKFRDDLQKFSSGQQPLNKWNEEAKSATAAINAGVIHAWKDAAEAVVYAFVTVEVDNPAQAQGSALEMFGSVPMAESGELIIEAARSVIPYKEWAEYLAGR